MINELNSDYKNKLLNRFDDSFKNIVDNLVEINVKYYNFNNEISNGTLICNRLIADKLINIFNELFENKYKIEKINLIDDYYFDDILSMEDNNTSCFNYRKIINTDRLSLHSYGLAVDINPLYNPCYLKNGVILPWNGEKYYNRFNNFEHKIDTNDLCYKLFIKNGFEWGGLWPFQDYHHFQYKK